MIRHFQINFVRRKRILTRPAFINNLNQFVSNVQTPAVCPAILKPFCEFLTGIMIADFRIEFALK